MRIKSNDFGKFGNTILIYFNFFLFLFASTFFYSPSGKKSHQKKKNTLFGIPYGMVNFDK
jgi:hypothetical protein